jgi:hypothetical protein
MHVQARQNPDQIAREQAPPTMIAEGTFCAACRRLSAAPDAALLAERSLVLYIVSPFIPPEPWR